MATIAVVDDHPGVLAFCAKALERAGHNIVALPDASNLMEHVTADDLDAVVLDLFLPPPDGLEVLGKLRKHHPELPVVAISGGPSDYGDVTAASTYLRVASHLGAAEVLQKPLEPQALVEAVQDALDAGA